MNTSIKEELKAIIEAFETTPTKNQTLEMCEAAVEHDGLNIKKVSKRLLSKELCVKAVNSNPNAFFLLGREFVCKDTLMALYKNIERCERTYGILYEIDKKINRFKGMSLADMLDEELAKVMISVDGRTIQRWDFSCFRDNLDVVEAGLESWGDIIKFIPEEKVTKEHVLKAIKGRIEFGNIPVKFLENDDVLDTLVATNKDYFRYIPQEKLTYERSVLAVKAGVSIKRIPKECLTQELSHLAVEADSWSVEYIPLEFLTRELILEAAEKSRYAPLYVDVKAGNEELAYELVLKGVSLEAPCICEYQSQRIVDVAVANNVFDIRYAKEEFIDDEMVDKVILKNPKLIDQIPLSFINQERVETAVKGGVSLENKVVRSNQTQKIIDLLLENDYFKDDSEIEEKLKLVDEQLKTKEFFRKFVVKFPRAINLVPVEMLDEEICYIAACAGASLFYSPLQDFQSQRIVDASWDNGGIPLLKYVKDEFKTDEIIEKAIEYEIDNFYRIPEEKMKEEFLYKFVCKNGRLLGAHMDKQTKRIAEKAFEMNKDNFEYIRKDLKTKEMCDEALEHDKTLVFYVPEDFATEEMWIEGIRKVAQYRIDFILQKGIPQKFCTNKVFIEIIKRGYYFLGAIPKEYLTLELQMAAFEIDEKSLVYFDM